MSSSQALVPGPWRKSAAWRGASFMLGIAILVLFIDWALGSRFEVGFGRLIVILIISGLTLSIPYGLAWLRDELPPEPTRQEGATAIPARVEGENGHTYVIVHPPSGGGGGGLKRAVRAKELSPGWYALYTVTWRWPVLIGDALLSGLWSVIGRVFGRSAGPRSTDLGEIDHPEKHPPPDRTTF